MIQPKWSKENTSESSVTRKRKGQFRNGEVFVIRDAARFREAVESLSPEQRVALYKAMQACTRERPRYSYPVVLMAIGLAYFLPSPFETDAISRADLSYLRPYTTPISPIFRTGLLNGRVCRGNHIRYKMSYAPRCGRPTPDGIIVPVFVEKQKPQQGPGTHPVSPSTSTSKSAAVSPGQGRSPRSYQ